MTEFTLSNTERLTAVLLADCQRETTRHNIVKCWSCGHGYTYRRGELNGNFCSVRCQDWYDAGNPGLAQEWLKPMIDWHSITGWRVVAGPIEIGSDYYAPLRRTFERRKPKAKAKRSTIPNYTIKADGHGYWQPSTASRALGFRSVDCGFDCAEARAKAQELNAVSRAARKAGSVGKNTNREAA
jgi:hypothetical protein